MEDLIEEVVDVVATVPAGRVRTYVAGGFIVGAIIGATATYFTTRARIREEFAAVADAEIAEAKDHYSRVYKEDKYRTPADAMEALAEADNKPGRAYRRYTGIVAEPPVDTEAELEVFEGREVTTVETELEVGVDPDPGVAVIDAQERSRRRSDIPYVVASDEFFECNYDAIELVYYAGDDVLCEDQSSDPIANPEKVVGPDSLTRFGIEKASPNTVLVLSDSKQVKYEIVRSDGHYSVEVLGLDPTDPRN